MASEAKAGSRIPREIQGWFPWMVFFFSGWFLCKTSPKDAPAKAAFPGSQLGQAENGGLLAVWGEPLRPLLPARLWLWAWRVLGAVLPSSNEIPPRSWRGSLDHAQLHFALAAHGRGTSGAQAGLFWASAAPPRLFGELLTHNGEIRRRGGMLGVLRGAGRGFPPLKNSDPNRGAGAEMLQVGEHRNFT